MCFSSCSWRGKRGLHRRPGRQHTQQLVLHYQIINKLHGGAPQRNQNVLPALRPPVLAAHLRTMPPLSTSVLYHQEGGQSTRLDYHSKGSQFIINQGGVFVIYRDRFPCATITAKQAF